MFANLYPIVETVNILKVPTFQSKVDCEQFLFCLKICEGERYVSTRAAGESCGHQYERPMTHRFSSKRETARSLNQKLSSTF